VALTFYQESDSLIWKLIQQECPNYFTRSGQPNQEATNLFSLFKEDLLGLIDDYAELPLVDEFINSETGEVFEQETWDGETPIIYVEIDLLEKALTIRASLRLIAAKILDRLGFSEHIYGGERLTDTETDELLRIVYTSNWPEDRLELVQKIIFFVDAKNAVPFEEREKLQLTHASERSKELIAKIKSGEIQQINRRTDPAEETTMDPEAAVIKSIQDNEYKRDLFMMLTNAEQIGDTKTAELLLPVFETADYVVTEAVFQSIVNHIRQAGGKQLSVTTVEGGCQHPVPRYWNSEIGAHSELCRRPVPCEIHSKERIVLL
jgi:hypothetical protein